MDRGLTYFSRRGFSVNESRFPNIHASWGGPFYRLYFYVALTRRLKWSFVLP